MKRWKIIAVALSCLTLIGAVGCRPIRGGGDEEQFTGELIEVVRGDLIISVSGNGFLDVTNEARFIRYMLRRVMWSGQVRCLLCWLLWIRKL